MFIKCQHCKATYKIDEQKIPKEKSFVKCSNCSQPIPLDPGNKESDSAEPTGHVVECDSCHSRYMIPAEKIAHEALKVRCGKCSSVFTVPSLNEETDLDLADDLETENLSSDHKFGLDDLSDADQNALDSDDIFGDDELSSAGSDLDLSLDESEQEDDIDLDIDGFSSKPPIDATAEYLKSVDFSDESENEELDSDLNMGSVSPDQKYKFFLKPKDKNIKNKSIEEDLAEHWPEIQDETDELETEIDLDLPDGEERLIDDKTKPGSKNKGKRNKIAAVIFILLLLGVAIVLGWMLIQKRSGPDVLLKPFSESIEKTKISIKEPLQGRYISNKTTKKKIFVLQGKIENHYPTEVKVSSVKVKGTLYNNENVIIAEATVYAGNILSDKQLKSLSQEKVEALYNYKFGQNEANLDLNINQEIPFQVVFWKIPGKFHKLEAKIEGFSNNTK